MNVALLARAGGAFHRTRIKEAGLARRTNYGFEKRQKELKRQKKREKKLEAKRLKREAAAGTGSAEEQDAVENGGETGDSDETNREH